MGKDYDIVNTRSKSVSANIAVNKIASSTSFYATWWPPQNAFDGDNDVNGEGRTCFHGRFSPSDLTVDLGDIYELYDIRVYMRNACKLVG